MQARHQDPSITYITERFVREPEPFKAARLLGETLRPGMQVSPYEGHLLSWLIRISGATQALEVGSFVGYSTLWQASALPEGGFITAIEIDADHANHTRNHAKNAGLEGKIRVEQADAIRFLQNYSGKPFDYVFIDGVKKDYVAYLDLVMPHLTPNAWVIADNTLLFGAFTGSERERVSAAAKEAMTEFHARMASGNAFDAVMIPTFEGLIVSKRVG